jgi:hypothetical protein
VLVGAALLFFGPIVRGKTSSVVAGHQTALYPWAAYPKNGFDDRFPQSDQADEFHPWQVLMGRTLREDRTLPLWDPYTFGGSPFYTNGQNGIVYPPRLALEAVVADATWVHDLFLLAHVAASGLLMLLLLLDLRLRLVPALLGGSAWMFSSFNMGWLQLEHLSVMAVWLPAAVLLGRRALVRSSLPAAVGAATALALLILGANAEISLLVYLTVVGLVVGLAGILVLRARGRRRHAAFVSVGLTAVIAILPLLLAAASLLPTALAFQTLGRAPRSYAQLLDGFTVPLLDILHYSLVPAGTDRIDADDLNYSMTFVGTLTALGALAALLRRRAGLALGLALVVIAALIAIGTPLTFAAYHLVPGFAHFRPLGRIFFLWDFGLALLGALGLVALLERAARTRARGRSPRADRALAAAPAIALVAVALTIVQTAAYGRAANPPFQPREERYLFPETPAISAVLADRDERSASAPQRVLPLRGSRIGGRFTNPAFYANTPTLFAVESAAGYQSILPERTVGLWRVVAGESPESVLADPLEDAFLPSYFVGRTRYDLLARVGVTTLFAGPALDRDPNFRPERYAPLHLRDRYRGFDGRVLDLLGEQPRAYVVYGSLRARSPAEALVAFSRPGFDWRRRVVLEQQAGVTRARDELGPVAAVSREPNAVEYRVRSAHRGWLVAADSWAPGWHAKVNGREAKVLHANYAFRAVEIPAGDVRVELRYEPPGLRAGIGLSFAGAIVALALLVAPRVRARRAPAARP